MSVVISTDQSRVADAAGALAAAFANDPVFRWMGRDRPTLDQRLHHAFAGMVKAELRRNEPLMFMTSDGGCASIWHPIDEWKPSPIEGLRVAPGFLRSFGLRVDRALRVQSTLERVHPQEPHYHLAFIGTRPEQQGHGLGAKVLNEMTQRCDDEGVPAYLESSNPQNESLYVRHGFVATGPIKLPAGGPPMTAMWRTPR